MKGLYVSNQKILEIFAPEILLMKYHYPFYWNIDANNGLPVLTILYIFYRRDDVYLRNLNEIRIDSFPDTVDSSFVYGVLRDKSYVVYNPYNLRMVSQQKAKSYDSFYTISQEHVTHVSMEFWNIYSETFEIIHSRGLITLLAIYKIPKLKYVLARCAIRL